ncbi:MAG TPA: energy-coupling factor transporter transmembrane component T [Bryobacteraceae bacterium]|nr:energy-coupling factor transporter transmembrane component T [Bryobacteraceae bacterium]
MHHAVLDEWSRRESALHRRDPRAKTAALVVFLIVVTTSTHNFVVLGPAYLGMLVAGMAWARIPPAGALARAAVVLPFSLVFAGAVALAGDPQRAVLLAAKSYVSAAAVLLLVATTPLPALLRGFEGLGAPRFLLMVAQFLYRYLFVISEEAQHMRAAALSRGGGIRAGRTRFRAAAGALAVLFARSHVRASDIHRAMLARGFEGHFRLVRNLRFGLADALFLVPAAGFPLALRLALGGGV